jgi:hypothetical protein
MLFTFDSDKPNRPASMAWVRSAFARNRGLANNQNYGWSYRLICCGSRVTGQRRTGKEVWFVQRRSRFPARSRSHP